MWPQLFTHLRTTKQAVPVLGAACWGLSIYVHFCHYVLCSTHDFLVFLLAQIFSGRHHLTNIS
nr:MAG TPA: hypothetical protein [Caudoviricetes sp.]